MSPLAEVLRRGIEGLADETSMTTETAIDIVGPIDLEELADYLLTFGNIVMQS